MRGGVRTDTPLSQVLWRGGWGNYTILTFQKSESACDARTRACLKQARRRYFVTHCNSSGMLPEAVEETGSGFRKTTGRFRDESSHR